jgi:GNAT superfamily N-acetyltransferase
MHRDDRAAVVGALTRAFYGDPLLGFFLPNLVQQSKGTLAFMKSGVHDAEPYDEIWVAKDGDHVAAAAVWLPPEGYPRGFRRDMTTTVRIMPAFSPAGWRMLRGLRLLSEVDKAHHAVEAPHMYLAILGSEPLYRGAGAGSAVLQPVLDRCDEQGMAAYLETQKESNLAYYARHAFDVVQKLEVKGVPPIWTLLRKPR